MLARLLVLIVLSAALGCAASHPSAAPATTAIPLDAITVETLDGRRVALAAELRGRPALVSLWATWCTSCATEFGALARLAPKAEAVGAYVVAVAEGEPRATVAAFVRDRQLHYPQLVDEGFVLGDVLGERRVPTTIVLDAAGTVVYRGGVLDRNALAALDRVIGPSRASR